MEKPKTCAEAAARFREWHRKTASTEMRPVYRELAVALAAFGDTPVPQPILDTWDFASTVVR